MNNKRIAGGISIPDFKLYYRQNKTTQYCRKDSTLINGIEDLGITYGHLIFDKEVKKYSGEETASSTKGADYTGYIWKNANRVIIITLPKTPKNKTKKKPPNRSRTLA